MARAHSGPPVISGVPADCCVKFTGSFAPALSPFPICGLRPLLLEPAAGFGVECVLACVWCVQ